VSVVRRLIMSIILHLYIISCVKVHLCVLEFFKRSIQASERPPNIFIKTSFESAIFYYVKNVKKKTLKHAFLTWFRIFFCNVIIFSQH